MHGEPNTTYGGELPPIPVPPPDGPHLLPPTPPPRDTLSLPTGDSTMPALNLPSLGLGFTAGLLTPRSYASFSPPAVQTPGAHDIDLLNELREASNSPNPIHEILRDPVILSSLLTHRKKPRRASSSSQTPTIRGRDVPSERARPESTARREGSRARERDTSHDRDRERERERENSSSRAGDAAAPIKTRKKDRDRDRDSDSVSILTQVLAEEERQARHLKAVLRQTGTRLEEELRRADAAETRARTAEINLQDVSGRLAVADAGRHQADLDATRAQEECRRWQMQADTAERETRRLQSDLARTERMRAEAEEAHKEARDAARRAEQMLREWQAREEGREEVRRLEVRRRLSDGRDEGFEDGRAEGYEAGHRDGYDAGRDEGYETGRAEGFNAGRLTEFEEGKKAAHNRDEEGRKIAFKDGYDAGYAKGRKDAFARFAESVPLDNRSVTEYEEDERTKRWVDATRKMREREPSPHPTPSGPPRQQQSTGQPQPQPPPGHYQLQPQPQPQPLLQPQPHPAQSPLPRGMPSADPGPQIYVQPATPLQANREPSPAPKLVWLHRPLNHHRESQDNGRPLPVLPEQTRA